MVISSLSHLRTSLTRREVEHDIENSLLCIWDGMSTRREVDFVNREPDYVTREYRRTYFDVVHTVCNYSVMSVIDQRDKDHGALVLAKRGRTLFRGTPARC